MQISRTNGNEEDAERDWGAKGGESDQKGSGKGRTPDGKPLHSHVLIKARGCVCATHSFQTAIEADGRREGEPAQMSTCSKSPFDSSLVFCPLLHQSRAHSCFFSPSNTGPQIGRFIRIFFWLLKDRTDKCKIIPTPRHSCRMRLVISHSLPRISCTAPHMASFSYVT